MNLIISNSSGKPIYEQITAQIKNSILSGELQEGEALPSMRALAKDLRISVITTKRAYEDLERDGFVAVSYTHLSSFEKDSSFLVSSFLKRTFSSRMTSPGCIAKDSAFAFSPTTSLSCASSTG